MAEPQIAALASKDVPALVNQCAELLRSIAIQPQSEGYTKSAQLNGLRHAVLGLRLRSWGVNLPAMWTSDSEAASGSLDAEAARALLLEILEDLRTAQNHSMPSPVMNSESSSAQPERASLFEGSSLDAVTKGVSMLASRAGHAEFAPDPLLERIIWELSDQKRTQRLIEDLTEKVDGLAQLTSPRADAKGSPDQKMPIKASCSSQPSKEGDIMWAFWLGVAASAVDPSLRTELTRVAADNIAGFSAPSESEGQAATYHQGHVYSNMSAEGNAKVVYGDSYGPRVFDDVR